MEPLPFASGEAAFTHHVALLADSRMGHPANATQRARLVRGLQQRYGNGYVQRVVEQTAGAKGRGRTNLPVNGRRGQADSQAGAKAEHPPRASHRAQASVIQRNPDNENDAEALWSAWLEDLFKLYVTNTDTYTIARTGKSYTKEWVRGEWEGHIQRVIKHKLGIKREDPEALELSSWYLRTIDEASGDEARKAWLRQEVTSALRPSVSPPDLSGLRTIAQGFIGDYFSAAKTSLTDFESDVGDDFDWSSFWVAVGGSLIGASAVFATGGTAFLISLSGIAVSTVASASDVTSTPEFHREAVKRINDVVSALNDQVDRVTREVHTEASEGNWSDNRTREELLKRMVKPEHITISEGGLPNLDQPVVAATIEEELLLKAAQLKGRSFVNVWGPAVYDEVWDVEGSASFELFVGYELYPPSEWSFSFSHAFLRSYNPALGDINEAMNSIYSTYGRPMNPEEWPIKKRLVLRAQPPINNVYYEFDKENNFIGWSAISARSLEERGQDPDAYLTEALDQFKARQGGALHEQQQLSTG